MPVPDRAPLRGLAGPAESRPRLADEPSPAPTRSSAVAAPSGILAPAGLRPLDAAPGSVPSAYSILPNRPSGAAALDSPPAAKAGTTGRTADEATAADTPEPGRSPARSASGDDGALFTRQSPVLGVDTVGPKRIVVGKESTYQLTVTNSGPVAADQVSVTVDVPDWADVVGAEASAGTTNAGTLEAGKSGPGREPFRWKVGKLEAKGREKLSLRIVPRATKPFDLAVKCDYTPAGAPSMIEVQEPKLQVELHGPRRVRFGKPEMFRLELANTGNGDAENVIVSLVPEGAGGNAPVVHRLGALPAGEKKTIEVELTARQAGTLAVKVDVRGDGGASAQLTDRIVVERAALAVSVDAPALLFVGSEVTYQIAVKNPGTAATGKVELSAALPPGVKFLSATHGGRAVPGQGKVAWTLEDLAPGAEATAALTCTLSSPGRAQLQLVATAEADLVARAAAAVEVEAVADLKLSVKDPGTPVAVGAEAAYEIRLQNRGSKGAEEIEVIAYFGPGVEPVAAEGAPHRVARGRVSFNTIPSIAPGETLVLKVTARAEEAGAHPMRTEVRCKAQGTRLVSEETTRFYRGGRRTSGADPSPPGDVRTADRSDWPASPSPK
jgi:uncharacterized repeat protein (TIGR01451 family)